MPPVSNGSREYTSLRTERYARFESTTPRQSAAFFRTQTGGRRALTPCAAPSKSFFALLVFLSGKHRRVEKSFIKKPPLNLPMRLKILPCFRLADGKLKHHQPAVGKAEGGHGACGAGVLRMYVRHVAGAKYNARRGCPSACAG